MAERRRARTGARPVPILLRTDVSVVYGEWMAKHTRLDERDDIDFDSVTRLVLEPMCRETPGLRDALARGRGHFELSGGGSVTFFTSPRYEGVESWFSWDIEEG